MTATRRTLTLDELSLRTGHATERLEALLLEDQARGIVEKAGNGYRLTPEAERRYGQALRNFGPPDNGPNHEAGVCAYSQRPLPPARQPNSDRSRDVRVSRGRP